MGTKTIIRLIKAFTVSAVAVYVFVNGPMLYNDAYYWIQSLRPAETNVSASGLAMIEPILLPVSTIDQQPLPNQATITIEKINVDVPIVFGVGSNPDDIYNNLTNGVVHYSPTSKPGQGGPSIILCHSSLYPWQYNKYGAPCAQVGKLVPGDRITVKYSDGRIFNYRMKQTIIFNPLEADGDKRLAELESNPKPTLILVTCYPVGSNTSRAALEAVLE